MHYRIRQVADLAGVSVRTLHHYDALGLLSPARRSASGYRVYGEEDMVRLQQVLFYKELDMPLSLIRDELDRPGFDPAIALLAHRKRLEERAERIRRLLATIDKTIAHLGGEHCMLSTEELYEGFPKEEAERFEREAEARWGHSDAYKESRRRIARMSKERWAELRKEGRSVDLALAKAYSEGFAPGSLEVRAMIGRKIAHLRNFYEPSAEMVKGLGAIYVEHPEFRATYDAIAIGLAEFLRDGMTIYADEEMLRA